MVDPSKVRTIYVSVDSNGDTLSDCCCVTTCTEYIVGDANCPGKSCCFNANIATCYTVEVPDVIDDTCSECDTEIRGPHTFDDVSACIMPILLDARFVLGCANVSRVTLAFTSSGADCLVSVQFDVGGGGGTGARYDRLFSPDYDVTQGFELDYVSNDVECQNWPATIQVVPCF